MTLYFKSCLRCKDGTVELGSDNFGSFLTCITCGYTINSRSIRSNGSIEQPETLEEDVVMVPGFAPAATIEESSEENVTDDGFEPDIELFSKNLENLEIEIDQAAAI